MAIGPVALKHRNSRVSRRCHPERRIVTLNIGPGFAGAVKEEMLALSVSVTRSEVILSAAKDLNPALSANVS